jgi:hypothetical protein
MVEVIWADQVVKANDGYSVNHECAGTIHMV